ncbi:BLUF domain-containing protein [Asticcacaulis taihuensis]|uniref:BLUF domain-containing protein n=1 Tax=Asticcacaulis taihuensis TaxID=260084 RepID=UPI0026E96B75|nr:BLUF domain-containing protein [Asticcacaulis taihuensis]
MLTQLIYHSHFVPGDHGALSTVRNIIEVSEINNGPDGVTGFLIFDKSHFLQILEGAPEDNRAPEEEPRHKKGGQGPDIGRERRERKTWEKPKQGAPRHRQGDFSRQTKRRNSGEGDKVNDGAEEGMVVPIHQHRRCLNERNIGVKPGHSADHREGQGESHHEPGKLHFWQQASQAPSFHCANYRCTGQPLERSSGAPFQTVNALRPGQD